MPLFKKKDSIEKFWNWFAKNKDEFNELNDSNKDEKLDRMKDVEQLIERITNIEVPELKFYSLPQELPLRINSDRLLRFPNSGGIFP